MLRYVVFLTATLVLVTTAFRIATRYSRVASIDAEVHEGHATDRWGVPAVPGQSPDAATVWRIQQIAEYDRITWIFGMAAVPATIVIVLQIESSRRKRSRHASDSDQVG